MSGPGEFRFAQVDTGQIYLRHQVCGEIDWRAVDGLDDAGSVARTHVCPVPPPKRCSCDSEHCDGPCADTYGYCNADTCLCPKEDE